MGIIITKTKLLSATMLATGLMLAGCTNSDYDFNEVDLTVGIGGDGLALPRSSSDTIQLSDVFDIDDAECVVINEETKDYVLHQDGGEVDPARPFIDIITVEKNKIETMDVHFNVPQLPAPIGMQRVKIAEVKAEDTMALFDYSGDKTTDVKALYRATSNATFKLEIDFSPAMKDGVVNLKHLKISFPAYMHLADVVVSQGQLTAGAAELVIDNVNPAKGLVIAGRVSELDFTVTDKGLGQLVQTDDRIELDGSVYVSASFDEVGGSFDPTADFYMANKMEMSNLDITSATGLFAPNIELKDLGKADIGDVPDFLRGNNVVIDLWNPQIVLTLANDMDVAGYVSGTLNAYKDGKLFATAHVPELKIKASEGMNGGVTRICVCRDESRLDNAGDFDVVASVANLSDLVRTIPDSITFSAEARADDERVSSFELGHQYTISPSYFIEAPLAFGSDARIAYNDTINDLNDDVKDFELTDNSYLQVTANIENRVPFYLTVKAKALGLDGNPLGDDRVSVEVDETIIASSDGKTSEYTPVVIRVSQKTKGALKDLDGIAIMFEGDASIPGAPSVEGIRLNSEKHFIIAHDVEVKLVGKIIADFN